MDGRRTASRRWDDVLDLACALRALPFASVCVGGGLPPPAAGGWGEDIPCFAGEAAWWPERDSVRVRVARRVSVPITVRLRAPCRTSVGELCGQRVGEHA